MGFIRTLYLLACQVRVTVGDSGLCCCVCVTSFERLLTPLFVYSGTGALGVVLFQVISDRVFLITARNVCANAKLNKAWKDNDS